MLLLLRARSDVPTLSLHSLSCACATAGSGSFPRYHPYHMWVLFCSDFGKAAQVKSFNGSKVVIRRSDGAQVLSPCTLQQTKSHAGCQAVGCTASFHRGATLQYRDALPWKAYACSHHLLQAPRMYTA
jgi:hypothetical protein